MTAGGITTDAGPPAAAGTRRRRMSGRFAHRPHVFLELVRHFTTRSLVSDTLVPQADATRAVGQVLALVAGPGLAIPFLLIMKYLYLATTAPAWIPAAVQVDRCLFVSYALAVTGIAAAWQWDALGLDRRDHATLAPLPLPARTVQLASCLAQCLCLALFVLAANCGPVLLFPVVLEIGEGAQGGLAQMIAQSVSTVAGCTFVFFLILTVRGILPVLLGERTSHRLTPWVQAGLIVSAALLLFLYPQTARALTGPERGVGSFPYWVPSLWFTGLQEWLLGARQPLPAALAGTAIRALAAVLIGYSLTLILVRRQYARFGREGEKPVGGPASRWRERLRAWLDRRWLTEPLERAAFHFCLATLFRSRRQKLIVTGAVALAVALAAVRIAAVVSAEPAGGTNGSVLAIPLILSFCLLLGVRYAAAVPAELPANWLFQLNAPLAGRPLWRGCRKFVFIVGVLPPLALLPLSAGPLGWGQAACFHGMVLLLGASLREVLFLRFDKIPFTCHRLPGAVNLKATWPLFWIGFSIYVHLPVMAGEWLSAHPHGWIIIFAGLLSALIVLHAFRNRRLAGMARFVFDEEPEPAVQGLNLLP